jgi:hypothetical protein
VAGEHHGHGWSSGVPALLCQECGTKQVRVKVEEGTMMVCESVVNWFASVLQEKRRCMWLWSSWSSGFLLHLCSKKRCNSIII